jgi:hypothetical protein
MKIFIANCRLQISNCKLNIEGQSERGVILKFALCILKFEIRSFAQFGLYYCLNLVGLRRSFGRSILVVTGYAVTLKIPDDLLYIPFIQ